MPQTPGGPSDELVRRLYDAKFPHHKPSKEMSVPEKVGELLELQKIAYGIRIAQGDKLQPWEKPWDVEP